MNSDLKRFYMVMLPGLAILTWALLEHALPRGVLAGLGVGLIAVLTFLPVPGPRGPMNMASVIVGRPVAFSSATRERLRVDGLPLSYRVSEGVKFPLVLSAWLYAVHISRTL